MEIIFSDREQRWLVRYAWDLKLSTAAVVRMAVKEYMKNHAIPSEIPKESSENGSEKP